MEKGSLVQFVEVLECDNKLNAFCHRAHRLRVQSSSFAKPKGIVVLIKFFYVESGGIWAEKRRGGMNCEQDFLCQKDAQGTGTQQKWGAEKITQQKVLFEYFKLQYECFFDGNQCVQIEKVPENDFFKPKKDGSYILRYEDM